MAHVGVLHAKPPRLVDERTSNSKNLSFMNDEFLMDDLDDDKTVEFIRNFLPIELKEKFSDDDLYYIIDVIADFYFSSGLLDAKPDADGCVEIDVDKIVAYIIKEAKKDKIGDWLPEDIELVVQAEMEYGNSLGQVD